MTSIPAVFSPRLAALNVLGMALLVVGSVLGESPAATAVRIAGCLALALVLVTQARAGYLRRKPHWTAASWRRYLLVCMIPMVVLALFVAMMVALEYRLPIVGAPRSPERGLWAVGTLITMFAGVGGIVGAIGWLASGDPTKQFEWPRWMRRRDRGTAAGA